jgi:predicted alpha/beta hydrolase family esterase
MDDIFIFVNGILTWPGNSRNWTGRAVTHYLSKKSLKAERVEYFAGVVGKRFWQRRRAKKLAKKISFYTDRNGKPHHIHLVGHSNGCDVIIDALRIIKNEWGSRPNIATIHFISSAAESDFNKNGLNSYEKIDKVFIWIAGKDTAMRYAGTYLGKLLSYGTMGRDGATNLVKGLINVSTITEPDFGHGSWFNEITKDGKSNWLETMNTIYNLSLRPCI